MDVRRHIVIFVSFMTFFYCEALQCPDMQDIRTKFVTTSFNLTKFEGIWYEAAYHDYTMPSICRCQRSIKTYNPNEKTLYDVFSVECMGHTYVNTLHVKVTDVPGLMKVKWPLIPLVTFPDTVVAVHVDASGNYEWHIDFQCVQELGVIDFVGIGFYHRRNNLTRTEIENMFVTAREQGLGDYMEHGAKVTVANHKHCKYPD